MTWGVPNLTLSTILLWGPEIRGKWWRDGFFTREGRVTAFHPLPLSSIMSSEAAYTPKIAALMD